jgi:hypothetical protein
MVDAEWGNKLLGGHNIQLCLTDGPKAEYVPRDARYRILEAHRRSNAPDLSTSRRPQPIWQSMVEDADNLRMKELVYLAAAGPTSFDFMRMWGSSPRKPSHGFI